MNIDIAIIREWAEAKVSGWHFATDYDLSVARYILATTTAPTMADIAWDDAVHAGLCAEHEAHGLVRMLEEHNDGDILFLYVEEGRLRTRWSLPNKLTPLPGTRVDLTPRRVDTCESSGPVIDDEDGLNEKKIPLIDKDSFNDEDNFLIDDEDSANDKTAAHPAVLTTEADYRNAPTGTVVTTEGEGAWTWTKGKDGLWETFGIISGYNNYAMPTASRQVLRWGWEA